jgi:hypothetical protein
LNESSAWDFMSFDKCKLGHIMSSDDTAPPLSRGLDGSGEEPPASMSCDLRVPPGDEARESAENLLALFEMKKRELAQMRGQHVKIIVDLCKLYGLRLQVSKSDL